MADRRLILLRHAKSDWSQAGLPDHDRPLASRGRRACALLSAYLRSSRPAPDLVLCSSALRTRQTLDGIRAGLPADVAVLVEDRLYLAGGADLLVRLREVDDGTGAVLVVGHNPGIHELATGLLGSTGHRKLPAFPTGALAIVDVAVPGWGRLGPGAARLAAFTTPKLLAAGA